MAKMKYEYRAIGKGTLSRPYRFFKEGDIITSFEPIVHPKLIPADQPLPKKPTVIVPGMMIDGKKQRIDYGPVVPTLSQEQKVGRGVPPVPKNAQYERGMAGVNKLEALLEGSTTAETAVKLDEVLTSKADDDKQPGGVEGTGNQEVI